MRQRQGAQSHKCRYSFKNLTTEGRKEQVGEGKKGKIPSRKINGTKEEGRRKGRRTDPEMAIRRLEIICPWWPLLSQNRAPKVKVSRE